MNSAGNTTWAAAANGAPMTPHEAASVDWARAREAYHEAVSNHAKAVSDLEKATAAEQSAWQNLEAVAGRGPTKMPTGSIR